MPAFILPGQISHALTGSLLSVLLSGSNYPVSRSLEDTCRTPVCGYAVRAVHVHCHAEWQPNASDLRRTQYVDPRGRDRLLSTVKLSTSSTARCGILAPKTSTMTPSPSTVNRQLNRVLKDSSMATSLYHCLRSWKVPSTAVGQILGHRDAHSVEHSFRISVTTVLKVTQQSFHIPLSSFDANSKYVQHSSSFAPESPCT